MKGVKTAGWSLLVWLATRWGSDHVEIIMCAVGTEERNGSSAYGYMYVVLYGGAIGVKLVHEPNHWHDGLPLLRRGRSLFRAT